MSGAKPFVLMRSGWVISCEHGGNHIPAAFTSLFDNAEAVAALNSHRGWDPGALALFKKLEPLADYAISSTTSRLLVELNRSLHHPNLFSKFTQHLPAQQRSQVLEQYYHPYRSALEKTVSHMLGKGQQVWHLSMHSFTPELNGVTRNADIGLLYDPGRQQEKALCKQWRSLLQELIPEVRVRFNYPYKGIADGFTTYLRKKFPAKYAGIEFELNQQWACRRDVYDKIVESVQLLKQLNG